MMMMNSLLSSGRWSNRLMKYRFSTLSSSSIEDSNKHSSEAEKVTKLGMGVNLSMATCKGAIGAWSGSTALVADAAHSLSDLVSDIVTLWTVKIARLPADKGHPYGYGKFEAVGSLSIGGILIAAGMGVGLEGIHAVDAALTSGTAIEYSSLWTGFPDLTKTQQLSIAAAVAMISIASKEILYHLTVKVGEKIRSKTLIANAWHHRTDAISSVVALGGILGSMAGVPLLDPVAGIAVAGMIIKVGVEISLDSVRELTDKSVETEVLDTLNHTSNMVDDVVSVSNVRARRMGPYTLVDLRIHVHERTSISAAQQIANRVKYEILQQIPDVSDVLVHIDVAQTPGVNRRTRKFEPESKMRPYRQINADVRGALDCIKEIQYMTHLNAHWVPTEYGHGTLIEVAIVVQPDMSIRDAHHVARKARRSIETVSYIAEADIHLDLYDEDVLVNDGRPGHVKTK